MNVVTRRRKPSERYAKCPSKRSYMVVMLLGRFSRFACGYEVPKGQENRPPREVKLLIPMY